MGLTALDRAFLADIAEANWLHHFVAAASFLRSGAESGEPGDDSLVRQILTRHNLPANLAFFSRQPLKAGDQIVARVQSLMTLRLFQERISATETLGTLLCALHERGSIGIARAHYYMPSGTVAVRLREWADGEQPNVVAYVGWPTLEQIEATGDVELAKRCGSVYPKLEEWTKQVAVAYALPGDIGIGSLGHPCDGYDPRNSVFVVLYREEHWVDGPEQRRKLIEQAYNKLKHGFNATTAYARYEAAAAEGTTAVVLEIPKSNEAVQILGKEIDHLGVLCREVARMTLEFDQLAVLPDVPLRSK